MGNAELQKIFNIIAGSSETQWKADLKAKMPEAAAKTFLWIAPLAEALATTPSPIKYSLDQLITVLSRMKAADFKNEDILKKIPEDKRGKLAKSGIGGYDGEDKTPSPEDQDHDLTASLEALGYPILAGLLDDESNQTLVHPTQSLVLAAKRPTKPDYRLWAKWRQLVNVSPEDMGKFLESEDFKKASKLQKAKKANKWLVKMLPHGHDWTQVIENWTVPMWGWCRKQVKFIEQMQRNQKPLEADGDKTSKYWALRLNGNDPDKPPRTAPGPEPLS